MQVHYLQPKSFDWHNYRAENACSLNELMQQGFRRHDRTDFESTKAWNFLVFEYQLLSKDSSW